MTLSSFAGIVWRHVPKHGDSLDLGAFLFSDGRWNRTGEYGCLYTSLSHEGCIAEYHRMLDQVGVTPEDDQERDIIAIGIRIDTVLDLTSKKIRRSWGLKLGPLRGGHPDHLEICRSIADLARTRGYRAVLSPSAAGKSYTNLNVYVEPPLRGIKILQAQKREPLNY